MEKHRERVLGLIAGVAERASTGHYLDRAIALAEAFQNPYLGILRAQREFLNMHCKPEGVDQTLYAVARSVLWEIKAAGVTPAETAPIAWGLDWDALKDASWLDARVTAIDNAKRNDHET